MRSRRLDALSWLLGRWQRSIAVSASILALGIAVNESEGEEQQPRGETSQGMVVIELFTSQGCSSCPPADALLQRFAEEGEMAGKQVLALSFHVDYWNYLGWRDPFSSSLWSQRQKAYAEILPGGRLFTPQVVINGRKIVGGWDESAIREEAAVLAAVQALTITEISAEPVQLRVVQPVIEEPKALFLALVESGFETAIDRGENANRALRNDRVVMIGKEVLLEPGTSREPLELGFDQQVRRSGAEARVVALITDLDSRQVLFAGSTPLSRTD